MHAGSTEDVDGPRSEVKRNEFAQSTTETVEDGDSGDRSKWNMAVEYG